VAKKGRGGSPPGEHRRAGVYIERSRVDVGGDLVGRDKVTIGSADRELDALFARLTAAIGETNSLSADEKQDLAAKGDELRAELEQPEPDLGKVARLKELLQARGGQIASVVGVIFRYPPVQETLKALTQRHLGA